MSLAALREIFVTVPLETGSMFSNFFDMIMPSFYVCVQRDESLDLQSRASSELD